MDKSEETQGKFTIEQDRGDNAFMRVKTEETKKVTEKIELREAMAAFS